MAEAKERQQEAFSAAVAAGFYHPKYDRVIYVACAISNKTSYGTIDAKSAAPKALQNGGCARSHLVPNVMR